MSGTDCARNSRQTTGQFMSILRIYQDTRGPGTCRSCGAPIEWAQLTTGKRMPFDPPIVVLQTEGNLIMGLRVIEHIDSTITISHFATCPHAKEWRRR